MSGFVAVWPRDGAAVDPARASSMLAALAHRGPDGSRLLFRPSAAVGHQHFWTTPEEVGEEQPVSNEAMGLSLVLDGRIDNREELLAAVGERDGSVSDAVLVLRAYEKWAESCFERLLGPFAAVILDEPRRRLVAARDAMGSRTLYYRATPTLVLVASEECALLAWPTTKRGLNELTLARFFALSVPRDGSTFFAGITELLPAHVLLCSPKGDQARRYWAPDVERRVSYRTDRDYAERFRSLLAESVRCRLRTVRPPGVMLSGGMDSTSVAALAAIELERRGSGPLRTFSWVFDDLTDCDERAWIKLMVERFGLDASYVPGDDDWPLRDVESWTIGSNKPWLNAFELLKQRLYSSAVGRGCRTLLNPVYADNYYAGDEEWLTDLLREGRFLDAGREVFAILREDGAAAMADSGIRRFGRNLLRGEAPDPGDSRTQLPWLTEYARHLIAVGPPSEPDARSARRPDQYEALFGPFSRLSANLAQHTHARGIELRDPFRDRRLVEFALAIPAHQLYRRGRAKHVQRNAMSDLLPPGITNRTVFTGLGSLFRRGLLGRGRGDALRILFREDAIWRPYVSEAWVLGGLRTGSELRGRESLVVWQCISAQLWIDRNASSGLALRSRERSDPRG